MRKPATSSFPDLFFQFGPFWHFNREVLQDCGGEEEKLHLGKSFPQTLPTAWKREKSNIFASMVEGDTNRSKKGKKFMQKKIFGFGT